MSDISDELESKDAELEQPDGGEEKEEEGFWWWVKPVLIAVGVTLLVRFFIVEYFRVPTGSMETTIMPGDLVLTEKVTPHFREPEPGEVVVFDNPAGDGSVLVKRVIAKAGQSVDLKNGCVYIDGKILREPYTNQKPSKPLAGQMPGLPEIIYPYTIPEGCVWVMGDNRTNSRDSRYFGSVSLDKVFGHSLCVIWPPADWKTL